MRITRRIAAPLALRIAGFGTVVAVWTAAASQLREIQLPSPVLVLQALQDNFVDAGGLHFAGVEGGYWSNTMYTVSNALLAFGLGSALGFTAGVLSARLQFVRDASMPVLILFGTVPSLVAAPFVMIWTGPGQLGQLAIVAFYAFVIVALASQNAALHLPPRYEDVASTLGASVSRSLWTIVVPSTIPSVVSAIRSAFAVSLTLQVAGELFGSPLGVGRVIAASQSVGYTAGGIAVVLLLATVGAVFDAIAYGALRWLSRWQLTLSR